MPKPQGTDNDLLQIAQPQPPKDEKELRRAKEAEETRTLNEAIRNTWASRDEEYAERIFGIKEEKKGEEDGE